MVYSQLRDVAGKTHITYVVNGDEDPTMFAAIEREKPDLAFVYNDPRMGSTIGTRRPSSSHTPMAADAS